MEHTDGKMSLSSFPNLSEMNATKDENFHQKSNFEGQLCRWVHATIINSSFSLLKINLHFIKTKRKIRRKKQQLQNLDVATINLFIQYFHD